MGDNHYIEVLDGLARVERRLRVIQHSFGHHVGIVGSTDEDDLAPNGEAAVELRHGLWDLLTEVICEVRELRCKPVEKDHGPEGPLGPLPPNILDALGE